MSEAATRGASLEKVFFKTRKFYRKTEEATGVVLEIFIVKHVCFSLF